MAEKKTGSPKNKSGITRKRKSGSQIKFPFTLPKEKKNLGTILAILALLFGSVYFGLKYSRLKKSSISHEKILEEKREPWMTVFVHGTFGTVIGLLNVFDVIKDDVEKTTYKKVINRMRRDPFFYQLQPLHTKGLVRIEPTFEPDQSDGANGKKYAIFPISKSYEELEDKIEPYTEKNYFYTYGWSGLISQQRRRKEAIRFFNALTDEYQKLTQAGIKPRIRLITHSHGGNVILNMAGMYDLLSSDLSKPLTPITEEGIPDKDHRDALTQLKTLLASLPSRENIEKDIPEDSEKKWDYYPEYSNPEEENYITIDELITLGTPVQPETTPFFFSDFFKTIYHIYSAGDTVQKMDWVSTKRYYSDQKITPEHETLYAHEKSPVIIQSQLMVNHDIESENNNPKTEEPSWLEKLLSIGQTNNDPSHKELWFMAWKNQSRMTPAQEFLSPLPFVTLIPACKNALCKAHDHHVSKTKNISQKLFDLDVNITFDENKSHVSVYTHPDKKEKKREALCSIPLPYEKIEENRARARKWEPENLTPQTEMDILHKYTRVLTY